MITLWFFLSWFPNFANVVSESMPAQVTSATTHHSNTRPWTISTRNPPWARRKKEGRLMFSSPWINEWKQSSQTAWVFEKGTQTQHPLFQSESHEFMMNEEWPRLDKGRSVLHISSIWPGWFLLSPLMGRYLSQSTPSPSSTYVKQTLPIRAMYPNTVIGSKMNMWQLTEYDINLEILLLSYLVIMKVNTAWEWSPYWGKPDQRVNRIKSSLK